MPRELALVFGFITIHWSINSHRLQSRAGSILYPSIAHPPRLANTELRDLVGGITTTVLGDVMALDMFRPVIE